MTSGRGNTLNIPSFRGGRRGDSRIKASALRTRPSLQLRSPRVSVTPHGAAFFLHQPPFSGQRQSDGAGAKEAARGGGQAIRSAVPPVGQLRFLGAHEIDSRRGETDLSKLLDLMGFEL